MTADVPGASIPPAPPMAAHGAAAEECSIGGYRLVRRLGEGPRAVTWLARGDDESVVLRVFAPSAVDIDIDGELAARDRLVGPHVARLLDVATGIDGRPVPVIVPVVGPRLGDLLARLHGRLAAGHATTVLAPIAAALESAHASGVSLGRLDVGGVRLDPAGAPVVVALGSARAAAPLPPRFRDREPGIVHDRTAFARLVECVVAAVDAQEQPAVRAAVARSRGLPAELELALFDAAPPLPLPLAGEPVRQRQPSATPAGSAAAVGHASIPVPSTIDDGTGQSRQSLRILLDIVRQFGLPEEIGETATTAMTSVGALLSAVREAVREAVRTARARVQRPRRGAVIAAAAGALALLAAIGLSALTGDDAASSSSTAADGSDDGGPFSTPVPGAPPDQRLSDPLQSGAAALGNPFVGDETAGLPERAVDPTAEQWPSLVGELVDRWLVCRSAPEADCITAVAHAGSGAAELLAAAASSSASEGGAGASGDILTVWASGARDVVVTDRMGAAAVVELIGDETATASLLVMRSEAGWRIRAVLD